MTRGMHAGHHISKAGNELGLLLQAGLRIRIGSGFNLVSGSGSRRAKMTHKRRKNFSKFMF
jgi:hypothetical protein